MVEGKAEAYGSFSIDGVAGTAAKIAEYHKQGFQVFQTATEIGLMSEGARSLFQSLGDLKLGDV